MAQPPLSNAFRDDRGVLRAAVFAVGAAMLLGAAVVAGLGCSLGATLRLGSPGVIVVLAVLFERWRYKRLKQDRPGPNWVGTEERFVDPETGKLVTVYYHPATGERRYVTS
jgi:hypothetical protein